MHDRVNLLLLICKYYMEPLNFNSLTINHIITKNINAYQNKIPIQL